MHEFYEALNGHGGERLALLVFFVVTGVTLIATTLITQWRKHRQAEMDAALKQEMLQRGMSAEEIERVLAAGRPKKSENSNASACR